MSRLPWLLFALMACSDKPAGDDSSDDTGKGKDDTATDDSTAGDDTNVPVDDGRLRPGYWRVNVSAVASDTCNIGIQPGNTFQMQVTADGEDNHFIDLVQAVIYDTANPGHFMANGVGLRVYDGIDCQLETRINANGDYTDWMNMSFYGKESILTFTGAECDQADINGGQDCRIDLIQTAIWQGDDPPDTGS